MSAPCCQVIAYHSAPASTAAVVFPTDGSCVTRKEAQRLANDLIVNADYSKVRVVEEVMVVNLPRVRHTLASVT
jgi:hypothetical protein